MKKLALFFKLTAHERRGFLILLCMIALLQFTPLFHRYFFQNNIDLEPLVSLEELSWSEPFKRQYPEVMPSEVAKADVHKPSTMKPFNPNNLSEARWHAMGFSTKQIQVIKNYESKGGRFYRAEDVKKIYSISESDFQRIAPYLRFEELTSEHLPSSSLKNNMFKVREAAKVVLIDINEADTLAWRRLSGIGSVLANRIVKFRDRLGGFHTINQVAEVYGLSAETFENIREQLLLGVMPMAQLAVNKLSEEELTRHPYINARDARHIVRYRLQHGPFRNMSELKKIYALDADFFLKIEPYLQFN